MGLYPTRARVGGGSGPGLECAGDQGEAVANQQALDQDVRIVAPGKDREAKGEGDGKGLSKQRLHPAWAHRCGVFPGRNKGLRAGKAEAVLLIGLTELRRKESLFGGDEKKNKQAEGEQKETGAAGWHQDGDAQRLQPRSQVERIAEIAIRARGDEPVAAHDGNAKVRGTPHAKNCTDQKADEGNSCHRECCRRQIKPAAARQEGRCPEPERAIAAARGPGPRREEPEYIEQHEEDDPKAKRQHRSSHDRSVRIWPLFDCQPGPDRRGPLKYP
jgi:hypothetical protein